MQRNTAIVLAAGQGKRMHTKVQKQFLEIGGRPVLFYSLMCFQNSPFIENIILVTGEKDISYCRNEIVEKYNLTKVTRIIAGGKERYDSVYQGLLACENSDYVLIHDGARPFITGEIIERGLADARKTGASAVGMPVKDTIKIADAAGFIAETPERSRVWMIQTPQIFRYELIRKAHESIRTKDMSAVTDDAMVVEQETGVRICLTEGSYQNIKITTPEDLAVAELFLKNS